MKTGSNLYMIKKNLDFFKNSMESGFGSDILDPNGAESTRQSSIIERV
jgi:hypothetical protein